MATMEEELRGNALKRLESRRAFKESLLSYAVVNVVLIVIWALAGGGYFWPGWVLVVWGIGLALHALRAYRPGSIITEEQIRREMDKLRESASHP